MARGGGPPCSASLLPCLRPRLPAQPAVPVRTACPTCAPSAVGPARSGWASAASAASGAPWRSSPRPAPPRARRWRSSPWSGRPHLHAPSARSAQRRRGHAPPGSASSIACSAAGSCQAPWSCWQGSRESASPPSCSTSQPRPLRCPASGVRVLSSMSRERSRPARSACAPSGSTRSTPPCFSPARPSSVPSSGTSRPPAPRSSSSIPCRPSPPPRSRGRQAGSPRSGPWPAPSSP